MKKIFSILLASILLSGASSCAYMQNLMRDKPVEMDFLEKGAKIDIKKFFVGDIEGFAITRDRDGKIVSTQTMKISGKWDENKGVIQQNVVAVDGTKDSRTWLITLNQDGTFDGVGHDVSSMAQGKQAGNAARMVYSLLLPAAEGKQ